MREERDNGNLPPRTSPSPHPFSPPSTIISFTTRGAAHNKRNHTRIHTFLVPHVGLTVIGVFWGPKIDHISLSTIFSSPPVWSRWREATPLEECKRSWVSKEQYLRFT